MAVKYLQKYALRVVENGYDICFIRPGEKRPFGKDWEAKRHGPKRIASAIEAGRGSYGVGVKTRETPGVDIDCYDEDLVEHMIQVTEDLCGSTLRRVGLAPKTLLVYRSDEPFPKTQSKVFIDDEGRPVKLEVLGDGQKVTGLVYQDRVSGEVRQVELEGIFVQIGLLPNTDWLKGAIVLSPRGEIEVDARGQTSLPGVFAAGDCTTVPYKQIIIAMGAGATASLSAFDHLIRA